MGSKVFILILIVLILLIFGIFIELNKTAYMIYGVCWEAGELEDEVINQLKLDGCTIEENFCEILPEFCIKNETTTRVCCPFKKCPNYKGLFC